MAVVELALAQLVVTSPADAGFALTTAPSPAFYASLVGYGVSALLFVAAFIDAPAWMVRLARWCLVFSFLAHGVEIGWRGVEGVHPGTSVREALGFLSWLVVGGYLLVSLRYALAVLGAFVAPVALGLLAIARLSPSGEPVEELSLLGRIHISLATLSVAIFAAATALAAVYLVAERNLKRKRFDGLLLRRGVALETLDALAHRLVMFGFPIFSAAMMLGIVWMAQRASGLGRPEYVLALVTWSSFAGLIAARTTLGWRGRRAAHLTIVGFTAALLVLGIYLLRRALGG
jgi:ABC-type uncharacterized transport system permease subunit